jgi:hypothetical protein
MASLHAFANDAPGDHDAVALTGLIRDGEMSPHELAAAAVARAQQVDRERLRTRRGAALGAHSIPYLGLTRTNRRLHKL